MVNVFYGGVFKDFFVCDVVFYDFFFEEVCSLNDIFFIEVC